MARVTYRSGAAPVRSKPGARERGGRSTGRRLLAVLCIEGEFLTLQQIGARLGVNADTASERVRREAAKDGPVRWEGLR
jgi:hypothetical protein